MSFLTRWFLDNPVAANLLMVFILVAGLLSFNTLRVESFPQIPPTRLEISVAYPGGTASQADAGITQRIEDAINSVPGINSITSQSSKGYASIVVKKNTGVELDRLMEDVRNQLENIEGFPALAERPRIVHDDFTNLASFVMVYGGQDDGLLQDVARRVETALKKYPDISKVTHLGMRTRQLMIEPDPDKLQRYGLTIPELAERVGQWSLEYRTGELKTDRGNIVLQGSGYADNLRKLENIPLITTPGSLVRLGEISEFVVTREPDALYRRNRDQVINIYWRQNRTQRSPEQIWAQLEDTTVTELNRHFPEVSIAAAGEFAEISEVQSGFKQAMLLTLLLIYVLLAIPLKSYWQPFIIMSVIPFGFVGALLGHWIMGLSFSLLSMFGMMAMTGVAINDSLVLMTRFNQLLASGLAVKEALIETGKCRLRAIFLTTVTTVCGLLPLLSETSEQAQYLKPAAVSLVFGELFATPITLILIQVLLGLGRYGRPHEVQRVTGKLSLN